ncbi:MAG TPA: MEDS domain-containing protein [Burkholderiales bacterium]|nr:MEDS domain-containing protein [Burkholderiales bacterium]
MGNEIWPREPLRHRLVALGVPPEAHGVRTLAEMLPVARNGTSADAFDADALAEALIHLIDSGIARVPCQLDNLLNLNWGAHLCQFYQSEVDLFELFAAYFRQGLESGEYCVCILPDEARREALCAALEASFPSRTQAFECLTPEQWYLDPGGGLKPASLILSQWSEKAGQALRAGFGGLRCAAQTDRVEGFDWEALAEYECAANAALCGLRIKAVCAYPLRPCNTRHFTDLRNSHEHLLVKCNGWWHRIDAPEARTASAVLTALRGDAA